MHFEFDQSAPIYQQLADQMEEMIFSGLFPEGQQVPSTTQLSQELHINPATVLKGMNLLVDHHLLEKKRGLGMFVKKGAKERIMEKRKEGFYQNYVVSLIKEATKLQITEDHLLSLIQRGYQNGNTQN
ncbi:GntR family transcriptional regulator [Limosilactobacillus coleohominis]|uniref:GntR family transcriptional regulator n=1 Tax=Limosilactobacillus coleohominis TaxID=181675 RepID=A0ABS2GYP5_9LACO|nr:GntR family transcriptional regulator [Limosilactobacillus coleohominis]MBM6940400.1 GntR family transcriptional regulator [Limosilactobacillus coleohominis]MBM6954521.1 GntR family transcriptional regulator [Limosilactobacillus coleohominis]HJA23421.1 GntR family transcriptional regulator [Candidatus Limosilactobacillus intestinavium]